MHKLDHYVQETVSMDFAFWDVISIYSVDYGTKNIVPKDMDDCK